MFLSNAVLHLKHLRILQGRIAHNSCEKVPKEIVMGMTQIGGENPWHLTSNYKSGKEQCRLFGTHS